MISLPILQQPYCAMPKARKIASRFCWHSSCVAPPWVIVARSKFRISPALTRPKAQPSIVTQLKLMWSSKLSMILQDFMLALLKFECRKVQSWKCVWAIEAKAKLTLYKTEE